jgi:transcriptional regulator with XRE-family HTH domain
MSKRRYIHPLRRWRFDNGVSLEKAAKRLKTSTPTLSYIENRRQLPSMTLAIRIRDCTGLTLDQLANAGQ